MLLLIPNPNLELSGFFRGRMDDCVCTVFSWVMIVCPEPLNLSGFSRSARSMASGLKLVRIACSIRFLSNRFKSITGVSGAGGITSLIFSIFTWKNFSMFFRHIRVPLAFLFAEKPAICGVAIVASSNNSRFISGSFSLTVQDQFTDLTPLPGMQ